MDTEIFDHYIDYIEAINLMNHYKKEYLDGKCPMKIMCLEHLPVYTCGKLGNNLHDKSSINGIPVVQTNRGGLLTYHGPGQVILYFVYDLKGGNCVKVKTLSDFILTCEESVVEVLESFKVTAFSSKDANMTNKGIYIYNQSAGKFDKIGFIGLNVSKEQIITHGISININNDLSYFERIIPCGLTDIKISSVKELGISLDINIFKKSLLSKIYEKLS